MGKYPYLNFNSQLTDGGRNAAKHVVVDQFMYGGGFLPKLWNIEDIIS